MGKRLKNRDMIECTTCKKVFSVPLKDGRIPKYCSDQCRRDAESLASRMYSDKKRSVKEKTCPICGTVFIVKGKGLSKIYCSEKCSVRQENNIRNKKRLDNRPTGICCQCDKEFKRQKKAGKFCSRKCYIDSLKAKTQTNICPMCGKEFNQRGRKLKYCSPLCSAKAQAEVYKRNTLTRRALRVTNGDVERINPKDIFDRDGWTCQICGEKVLKSLYKIKGTKRYARAPSIDHIIPISRGGQHIKSNVQCACYLCNCRKGNRSSAGQMRLFN